MRPAVEYDIITVGLPPSRVRLLEAHSELHSWKAVAKKLGVNIRYVWDYAVKGKLSANPKIRKKLLGRKSINEHLSTDRIQDMPIPLLRWAMENRVECSSDVNTVQEDVTDSLNGMESMAV